MSHQGWTPEEARYVDSYIESRVQLEIAEVINTLSRTHPITTEEVRELIGQALTRRGSALEAEIEQLRELIARLGGPGALHQVQADQIGLELTRQRIESLELEQKERFAALELRIQATPGPAPEAFQLLRDDIEHLHKLHNTRTELLGKFLQVFDQIRLELKDQAVEIRRRGNNSEILELLREMIGKIGATATWAPDQEED